MRAETKAAGKPPRKDALEKSAGQGFGLSKAQKAAVEQYAVGWATRHYESQGWTVKDVGATHAYDLHGKRDGEELFIEVKGTTPSRRSVVLTANEVELHKSKFPRTALFVVCEVVLTGSMDLPASSGGRALEIKLWLPNDGDLLPMAYKYLLPAP